MNDTTKRCVFLSAAIVALALGASACSSNTSTVTSPTTPVSLTTETFQGSIDRGGSAIHPFAVTAGGYTVLVAYTTISPSTVTALGMGVGAWDGTTSTCGLNQTQNDTAKPSSTGLSATAAAGNYCIRVYDGGNIPDGVTASYALQVQHY